MSNNLYNLNFYQPYHGSNSVQVCDGSKLWITRNGFKSLFMYNSSLSLISVLIVPSLTKNLLSTCHLINDNSYSLTFDPYGFSSKDSINQLFLHRFNSHGPLYPLTLLMTVCWRSSLPRPYQSLGTTVSLILKFPLYNIS